MRPFVNANAGSKSLTQMTIWKGRIVGLVHQFASNNLNIMDTNTQGKLTEIAVLKRAIEFGYSVSIPFGDKDKYDQIWDKKGILIRVQVKTARFKNETKDAILFNCFSVSNRVKHKYTKKDIDYFATYWNGEVYLIPVEECSNEKTLWFTRPKNNCPNITLAEKYLLKGEADN